MKEYGMVLKRNTYSQENWCLHEEKPLEIESNWEQKPLESEMMVEDSQLFWRTQTQ